MSTKKHCEVCYYPERLDIGNTNLKHDLYGCEGLFGAVLDVFEKEPINKKNELLQLNNIVVIPHIGSTILTTRNNMIENVIENVILALNNERPIHLLNEVVLNHGQDRKMT